MTFSNVWLTWCTAAQSYLTRHYRLHSICRRHLRVSIICSLRRECTLAWPTVTLFSKSPTMLFKASDASCSALSPGQDIYSHITLNHLIHWIKFMLKNKRKHRLKMNQTYKWMVEASYTARWNTTNSYDSGLIIIIT